MSRIKISEKGLMACPGCSVHIRVAENPLATVCPFCSASLKEALSSSETSWLSRVAKVGRGSLIAASILGLGGLTACETEVQPVYGSPPIDTMQMDVVTDVPDQPAYGIPADTAMPDAGPASDAESPGDTPGDAQP